VQETFTELWQKADRFDAGRASPSTFIGLIARRRAIDWLRRKGRRPSTEPLPPDFDQRFATRSAAAESTQRDDLRSALARLPDETRRVFQLHFAQGLSHQEIAQRTDLPLGTVKTRLRRGLLELREFLQQEPSTSSPS
jgi:RNA polymerase sigma-70 factor (ECF subfamily)